MPLFLGRGNTLREAASLRDAPRMRLHALPLLRVVLLKSYHC